MRRKQNEFHAYTDLIWDLGFCFVKIVTNVYGRPVTRFWCVHSTMAWSQCKQQPWKKKITLTVNVFSHQ